MRLDVFSNDFNVSPELRRYAEARVWPAADHVGGRWVGVRFIGLNDDEGSPRVACQVDVWLRRLGLVTVRHTDTNPFVAVDCAAIRLRQAIARKIARSAPMPLRTPAMSASNKDVASHRPRLAVVIVPAGAPPRLGLGPWLRMRYGIEQLQTVCLSELEWNRLASGEDCRQVSRRVKDRLALALLGRPEMFVIAGHPPLDTVRHTWPKTRCHVARIVERIRSWEFPVEVIGAWVTERWGVDQCVVESEEVRGVGPRAVDSARNGKPCADRLAEAVWENEGGRLKSASKPAKRFSKHQTRERHRHVDSQHLRHFARYAKAGQRTSARHADKRFSGFRSHPAGLARA